MSKTCGDRYLATDACCTLPEGHEADKEERHHEVRQDSMPGGVKWTSLHPPPIEQFSSNQRRLVLLLLSLSKEECVEVAMLAASHIRKMDKATACSIILQALGRHPSKVQQEARLAVWNALRAKGLPFIRPEHAGDDQ